MNPSSGQPRASVSVLGAGGVGIFLATRLSRVAQVTMIVRPGTAAQFTGTFQVQGLEQAECSLAVQKHYSPPVVPVIMDELERALPVSTHRHFVIVACKAHELRSALESLQPRIALGTRVVLIQNGIGVLEEARAILPQVHWGRLICWFGVHRKSMEIVEWVGRGAVDWAAEESGFQQEFSTLLKCAGFSPREGVSPRLIEWRKALMNVSLNALCALSEVPNGRVLNDPGLKQGVDLLLNEALAVARAHQVGLDEETERTRVWNAIQSVAGNFNSTYQDLQAGRPTEISWLNGAVARLGRSAGVPVPTHELVTALVAQLEKQRIEKTRNSHLANHSSSG